MTKVTHPTEEMHVLYPWIMYKFCSKYVAVCSVSLTLHLWSKKTSYFYGTRYIQYPYFLNYFHIFFQGSKQAQLKSKCCFYSDFSFFMQLYSVKHLKCLRTRKYNLEHKCLWNLSLIWLFLASVAFYLNCLDRVVLAHPFWALATFPVCFSVLSCWTNREPSMGTKWSSWI
jgi:hypothetical protein